MRKKFKRWLFIRKWLRKNSTWVDCKYKHKALDRALRRNGYDY